MTREEIVRGLKIHLDSSVDCDGCPLKDASCDCFRQLTNEALLLLEKDGANEAHDKTEGMH